MKLEQQLILIHCNNQVYMMASGIKHFTTWISSASLIRSKAFMVFKQRTTGLIGFYNCTSITTLISLTHFTIISRHRPGQIFICLRGLRDIQSKHSILSNNKNFISFIKLIVPQIFHCNQKDILRLPSVYNDISSFINDISQHFHFSSVQ